MGKPHSTVIEINGKKYDARTGKIVGQQTPLASSRTPQSVDGVTRSAKHSKDVHHKSSKSKTLMRHAVKPPHKAHASVTPDEIRRIKSPQHVVQTVANSVQPYPASNDQREKRASSIKQNSLVRRFSDIGAISAPAPVTPQKMNVQPAPIHAQPKSKAESVIEKGLKNAQSHSQPAHKAKKTRRKGTKFASIASASLAVLLLVGFFGYQYAPNVAMHYATARSGVNASIPGYNPSGFSLNNHIQYTPGQITLTFRSNSDERQFNIVQRESTWNSESLKTNYVANVDKNVQVYEDKGRTIYIYNNSNATWVDGGVWYDIQGNSQLNSDQLIRIASSM